MNRFFISDTHFGHKNIIEYCSRPFTNVDQMNEIMISNWNNVVGPEDEVFHLGDVALGPWEKWHNILTRLNGYKTLVVGNHDRIFRGEGEKKRERFEPYYAGWFDVVVDEVKGLPLADGTLVNLSHFPYEGDSHDDDRYQEFRLADEGRVLIHGHTHRDQIVSRSPKGTLQIHVGADAFDYTPVSEDQIIKVLETQNN